MAKILLVEDDAKLAEQIKVWLEYDHHVVEVATAGDEALDRIRHYHFDLIVLDWMLPGMEGIEVCRRLRERGSRIPIIMLTGRDTVIDKTVGLDGGADDYVTKPVAPKELSARIRALLRRTPPEEQSAVEVDDLYVDRSKLIVRKSGISIKLQPREIDLLELFIKHPKENLSSEFIIEKIWPAESEATANLLKSYVNRLRAKFEKAGQPISIRSIYGHGYVYEPR